MPLDMNTRLLGPPALLADTVDENGDGVGYLDTLPAAFRRENATLNAAEWAVQKVRFGIFADEDETFNPYQNTEGTIVERYPDALVGVSSQEEKDHVIQRLHREEADLEVLDASGAKGFLAMFTAGVLDPIMFLPVGAAFRASRVARLAASGATVSPSAVRTAALTSRTGLLAASGAEIPLQLNQETRTAVESAANIGAATVLSGILGAGAHGISKGLRDMALRDIDRDIGGTIAGGAGDSVRVGAEDLGPVTDGGTSPAVIKVAQGLGVPWAIAQVRFNPMLSRLIISPAQATRKMLMRLAEPPFRVEGFAEGPAVESLLRRNYFVRDQLQRAERDLFGKYQQRVKGQKFQMKRKEFVKNAGEAQRVDSDVHGYTPEGRVTIEPEAKQLAALHNELYEDLAQQMVDLRILPEEVIEQGPKFATRYLRRRYLKDKIQRDRDATGGRRFEGIVRGWLRETVTAEERVFAAKLRPDLSEDEALEAAIAHAGESITDHIVGLAPGQGVVGRAAGADGSPLQNRVMAWDDERVVEFLDNDISNLTDQYLRTVSARLELHKMDARATEPLPVGAKAKVGRDTFVTVKEGDVLYAKGRAPSHMLTNTIQEVREEYKALMKGKTDKEIAGLQKALTKDEEVIGAFRDRLLGTFGSTSKFPALMSALRVTRALNMTAQLGGVTVSSIPDLGMNVFRHGLTRSMRGTVTAAFHPKLFKMSMKESQVSGGALELGQRVRFLELAELGGAKAENAIEAGAMRLTAPFSMATLMAPWNHFLKGVSGAITQTRILEVSEAIAKGRKVSASDLRDLDHMRIIGDMPRRIAEQHRLTGGQQGKGGVKFANTDLWTDDAARLAYRSAVGQQIDNTILTPGIADRPLLMSTEWGKSIGQYKSFAFAATGRILVTGAQDLRALDLYKLNGLLLMVTMGMMVEDSKRWVAGRDLEEDPMKRWLAGMDRSGVAGILVEPLQIADKTWDILPGGPISSRYAARNTLSSLGGPTFGLGETAFQVAGAAGRGFTESDVKAAVRLIPYSNLFYWRLLLGGLPANVAADAFNVPKTRR